jgi:ATP-binding cassette subfamily B protein
MPPKDQKKIERSPKGPSLLPLLKPYRGLIVVLIILTFLANGLNLVIPKIISHGIDSFGKGNYVFKTTLLEFGLVALFIFIFSYLQSIVQTYTSERVARDLRNRIAEKISRQSFSYIQKTSSSQLLTNLTSDVDAVKTFVSQAIVSIVSSVLLIVGASILLISINWKVGLATLSVIPLIGFAFSTIFKKIGILFKKSQEVIDWLNKVINESILGASLIRVLNSQQPEYDKFLKANTEAKNAGLGILRLFAALIPIISFLASFGMIIILTLGGRYVINGSMSFGEFSQFMGYLSILIFPIIMIGFMSSVIARAQASYGRIDAVLKAEEVKEGGNVDADLKGNIVLKDISLTQGGKPILKNVSLEIKAGTKTAIMGPTAAGKTQLLYIMTGLMKPGSGTIEYDGRGLEEYDKGSFHRHVGLVFQDSVMFNMTLRENIGFSKNAKDEDLEKAIRTAELSDFVVTLPDKLDTLISERGSSLSGGQKQRIMLARALALNPSILLLDDFTARMDAVTERKILKNIEMNYPGLTLISVTQKIAPIEEYDQIILLMEGEVLAKGTHKELMGSSPEYMQIFESQKSTSHYE